MKSPVMTSGRFFDFCKILESSNATIAKPNISPESSEHIEGRSMFRLNLENRYRHNFLLLVIFFTFKSGIDSGNDADFAQGYES